MNTHQREYFIHMISVGKFYHKKFCITEPSQEHRFDALRKYSEVLEKCKEEKLYTDSNILSLMLEEDMWSEDLEFTLNHRVNHELNELKLNLYELGTTKSTDYQVISTQIDDKKQEIMKLYKKRHSLISFTCEGIAEYAKMRHLIKKNVYLGKKKYKWKKYLPDYFIGVYDSSYIDEEIIREIARTKPWRDIWDCSKKSGGYLFSQDSVALSNNQRRLILWSSLYDNIREHEDCPPDFIIENDNMLDGWLYKINKEGKEKTKDEFAGVSKNPKINNAREVFILANGTPTEIKNKIDQIRSMNSYQSEVVKRSRVAKIRREGTVAEQNLPDIKREFKMQLVNEMRKRNGR